MLVGRLLVREVDVWDPEVADVGRGDDEGVDGLRVGETSVLPAQAEVNRQLVVLLSDKTRRW